MTAPAADRTSLLLPEGTRLVHIGPPKTGTTTIQGAFHEARAATDAQGVHYAGRYRHSIAAVQSVMHRQGFYLEGGSPSIFHWLRLLRDIRRSDASRVVLSSEFFADAQADDIRRIVHDLDPARVHVVVTLRPLAKIIPSQWQQYIQSASKYSFDDWLNAMLNREHSKITPSFWHRHRHDRLIERWAEVVGPEHVTVVVLDEGDRDRVLRVFEALTGLREGTLVAQPDGENRSLTLPEVEAVRAFNVAFHAEGLPRPVHSRVMNFGAARYLQRATPPPDAPRIEMPQWALDKAGAIAREMVDRIAASGVRVVGDLESLAAVPASRLEGDRQPPVTVPPSVAATLAMGVLFSSGLATEPAPGAKPGSTTKGFGAGSGPAIRAEPLELVRVPTNELFGILARRGRTAVTSRVRRIGRRG